MKIQFFISLITLILLQGCTLIYDVSKNVKLKSISGTKSSAQTGRTIVEVKNINRANIDSIYSSSYDIYTIQKVEKKDLFELHGITKNIKEFDKNKNTLIRKYGLKKLFLSKKNRHISDVLIDSQKLYLTASKKDNNLVYEYTNDMNTDGAKRIRVERKRAERERILQQQKAEKEKKAREKKARERKEKRAEQRRLNKEEAQKQKQIEIQKAQQKELLAQQKKKKELQKLNSLKRSIGKKVSWYGSHKIDTDDCVQLYFFRKCMWVTYKYKYTGILKNVNASSYTIQVTDVQLSIPSMVSMKYKQYQRQGISWGEGQVNSVKKVSTSHDINIM